MHTVYDVSNQTPHTVSDVVFVAANSVVRQTFLSNMYKPL